MIVKERACCFTGHRRLSSSPDLADALKKTILAKINEGYFDFLSGMALGFDSLAAQTILDLKKEFPLIRLFCIIPCADQDKDFSAAQKETYYQLTPFRHTTNYSFNNGNKNVRRTCTPHTFI